MKTLAYLKPECAAFRLGIAEKRDLVPLSVVIDRLCGPPFLQTISEISTIFHWSILL
jgi:hypothetical protein